jgi:hypothetical protein
LSKTLSKAGELAAGHFVKRPAESKGIVSRGRDTWQSLTSSRNLPSGRSSARVRAS